MGYFSDRLNIARNYVLGQQLTNSPLEKFALTYSEHDLTYILSGDYGSGVLSSMKLRILYPAAMEDMPRLDRLLEGEVVKDFAVMLGVIPNGNSFMLFDAESVTQMFQRHPSVSLDFSRYPLLCQRVKSYSDAIGLGYQETDHILTMEQRNFTQVPDVVRAFGALTNSENITITLDSGLKLQAMKESRNNFMTFSFNSEDHEKQLRDMLIRSYGFTAPEMGWKAP